MGDIHGSDVPGENTTITLYFVFNIDVLVSAELSSHSDIVPPKS